MTLSDRQFEQGPIRPPNEARSLLLRFTRNCPWNQCLFCPVYKNEKFSLRSVGEIKKDIDAVRAIADDIQALSWRLGYSGNVNDQVISYTFARSEYGEHYRNVAAWLYYGTDACFLQDADNLIMPPDDLVAALNHLKRRFPGIKRITSYTRSRTVVSRPLEALQRIRAAGLDRVHIGLESGYDPVLKLVRKGVTAAGHIEAGQKILAAGMELSEYVMPGLGGQDMWRENAVHTARVLNRINPHFIRLRSLRVPARAPLYAKLQAGEFRMQTDDGIAAEIQLFLSCLEGITSTVTSDHIMNLLEEVTGRMPGDKERMMGVIADYEALSHEERLIYRVGRRAGIYHRVGDLRDDPATYGKIRNLILDIRTEKGPDGVEGFIRGMVDQYI